MTKEVRTIDIEQHQRRIEAINASGGRGGAMSATPGIRIVLDGVGCGLDHCNCSPNNFLSISDGKTLLSVELSDEEARIIREEGRLDTI